MNKLLRGKGLPQTPVREEMLRCSKANGGKEVKMASCLACVEQLFHLAVVKE